MAVAHQTYNELYPYL